MLSTNRTLHRLPLLLLLIISLATPAWARLVIGVTPAVIPGSGDRRTLDDCAELLGNQLGEAVYLRSIDNEAQLIDWVARFRELDAALITPKAFGASPVGELVKVTDLASDDGPGLIVVTYAGQSAERIERLRALIDLPRTEPGRRLLQRSAPSTPPPSPRAVYGESLLSPSLSPQTPGASSPQPERARPLPKIEVPAVASPPPRPAPVQPAPVAPQAPARPAVSAPATVVAPPATAPALPVAATPTPAKPVILAPTAPASPPAAAPTAAPAAPVKASRLRLVFFFSLILVTGILLKLALLVRHWRHNRAARTPTPPPVAFPASTPDPAPAFQPSPAEPAKAQPKLDSAFTGEPLPDLPSTWESIGLPPVLPPLAEEEEVISLAGSELEPKSGNVDAEILPHLLRHCAELDEPAVMAIRTPHRETRLHFNAGKVSHVEVVYPDAGVCYAEKTGQLMVRDNLLSAAKLDQALEIVRRNPGHGLGAALGTIGALEPEGFRTILTRHAKTQFFFLLLFPEGEYRLEHHAKASAEDEAVGLEIDALLSDADYHQAEWAAIRKELPGLTTAVAFLPDGRDKLEKLQLSPAQLQLLAKIDGCQTLDALCATTNLPDYETCRFLYMMTRVGVLSVAAPS